MALAGIRRAARGTFTTARAVTEERYVELQARAPRRLDYEARVEAWERVMTRRGALAGFVLAIPGYKAWRERMQQDDAAYAAETAALAALVGKRDRQTKTNPA